MTDGELLEQAAKAIGLKYIKPAEGYSGEFGLIAGIETLHSVTDRCGATTWNPLADDGDAFRLAVKLGVQITIILDGEDGDHPPQTMVDWATEEHLNEPCAATRRAVVRAAAEIGKAKCD
jgi:hypothetical protein